MSFASARARKLLMVFALVALGLGAAAEGLNLCPSCTAALNGLFAAAASPRAPFREACAAHCPACDGTPRARYDRCCEDSCDLEPAEFTLRPTGRLAPPDDPPGLGIPADGLMTALFWASLLMIVVQALGRKDLISIFNVVVQLVAALGGGLGGIALIFLAITKLLVMLGLLMALPFGPFVYLALFGGFARAAASATLSFALATKVAALVLATLANPGTLKIKGLTLLGLTSLVCGILVSFLHGVVPGLLASVTDAIAGIIVGIVAVIWAIVYLISAIRAALAALSGAASAKPSG